MTFNGLVNKLKGSISSVGKYVKGAAVAGGLGLTSLLPYNADAQVTVVDPSVHMSATVKDSQGNLIENGSNLQAGQIYTGTLFLKFDNPSAAVLDVSALTTEFQANFAGLANSSDVLIQYTPGISPSNIAGVPPNDLFSNSTMSTSVSPNNNYTSLFSDFTSTTLNYNRVAISNFPQLSGGNSAAFLTFTIAPHSDAVGGNITFNYLTGASYTSIEAGNGSILNTGDSFSGVFDNNTQVNFLGGGFGTPGNLQYSITSAIPEPATDAAILGAGALALAAYYSRRKRNGTKNSI